MEGNAKLIKLICRDENVHLGSTQTLIKLLPQDDAMFGQISQDTRTECESMFAAAVKQEKDWARYLFKDGSMIGLNQQLLSDYIDWLAAKRMTAIGLTPCVKSPGSNPLPWTQKWIAGAEVQVAPQQTQISSYIIGGTRQDVTENTFKGLSL
jgi:ribonucleoside-diphosphate reductase beta chain